MPDCAGSTNDNAVMDHCGVCAGARQGDIDGDGSVNITDILVEIAIILNNQTPTTQQLCQADFKNNNTIDIIDVIHTINLILEDDYHNFNVF